jgi:hypothetical protein
MEKKIRIFQKVILVAFIPLCWFPLASFIGFTWDIELLKYWAKPFEVSVFPYPHYRWLPLGFFLGLAQLGITLYGLLVDVTARQALFLSRICYSILVLMIVIFLFNWEYPFLYAFLYSLIHSSLFAFLGLAFDVSWDLSKPTP